MAKTPSKSKRSLRSRTRLSKKAGTPTKSSPKKKPPKSKKHKHDPLDGTLIDEPKNKADPFAGTKLKKHKQRHGDHIEVADLDDMDCNKIVNLEAKVMYDKDVRILDKSKTKGIAFIGAKLRAEDKDYKVTDWSPSATESYGNKTLGKDSYNAGDMYAYKKGKVPTKRWSDGRIHGLYNQLSSGKHHIVVEKKQGDLKKPGNRHHDNDRWPDYLLLHKIIGFVEGSESSSDDDGSEDSD